MKRIVGHEIATDLAILVRNGYEIPRAEYFCTSTASKWVWPDLGDHSLEFLTLRLTDMGQWRPPGPADFGAMSLEDLSRRCGGDAEAAYRLYEILDPEITKLGIRKIWALAMDVLPILAEIGGRGMALDVDALSRRVYGDGIHPGLEALLKQEKAELEELLGIENLGSRAQLARALFGPAFGLTPLRRTQYGYSIDRTSLLWCRREVQRSGGPEATISILSRILAYTKQAKLLTTYYKPWLSMGREARVFSNYDLGGTATGRLSSWGMNLQNVPPVARELIIPSPGYDLIARADANMIELRTAAWICQDATLLAWLRSGADIHARQAARIFGLRDPTTQQEITAFKARYPLERQIGKTVNFESLFGVGPETFSWQLFEDSNGEIWIDPKDAAGYLEMFGRTFPGWHRHVETIARMVRRQEWIVSPTGRRWLLPPDASGIRRGVNYPVQSFASDLILIALRWIHTRLRSLKMKTRIIGEVHDDIVFETVRAETKDLTSLLQEASDVILKIVRQEFGCPFSLCIPFEIKGGQTWAALDLI